MDASETARKPASPELAAAMAEMRIYRDLLAEVLATFEKDGSGSGYMRARVQVRVIRQWRERAGMPASPAAREEGAG